MGISCKGEVYLVQLLGISQEYLRQILGTSLTFISHISGVSQTYEGYFYFQKIAGISNLLLSQMSLNLLAG